MDDKRSGTPSSSSGLQRQRSEALGRDLSGQSNDNNSPSAGSLKRLKLKVGGNTLNLTPGQHVSPSNLSPASPLVKAKPSQTPVSKVNPSQTPFPLKGSHGPDSIPEGRPVRRARRAVLEESDEDDSGGGEETEDSGSDSPPPLRKKKTPGLVGTPLGGKSPLQQSGGPWQEPLQQKAETRRGMDDDAEQGFREKRSPKPKVIWDPDGGVKDEKLRRVKGTPDSVKKAKRPARDAADAGPAKVPGEEASEVPLGWSGSPLEERRERRLSKPKVIWDPDDDERELLKVVAKPSESKGPVSPKVHASPAPKHPPKKTSKPSTGPFPEPGLDQISPVVESVTTPGKVGYLAASALTALQADPSISPRPVLSPQMLAISHTPGSLVSSEPGVSPDVNSLTPGKHKDVSSGVGMGSPNISGGRSPLGFRPPPERTRLQVPELHLGGERKEAQRGGEGGGTPQTKHGLASPGQSRADKRKQREDTEAERQLKKEERARKRKADTEKANREVQASAIQKILGQESTRKKREEAVQKRRDAKEEERLASGSDVPTDLVRVVDNASGTTVFWPASVPFPVELAQPAREAPPSRATCAAPSCENVYRYRDSISRLPLCSLQCYKALRQ